MTEPLTLWKMLRKHGVGLYAAQMICNDVMLNGVTIPTQGECQEQRHDLPRHEETIAGLDALTIRERS